MDSGPSPRSPHKNLKKPAAPLPPSHKVIDNPVRELIDLTDNTSPKEVADETVIPAEVLRCPNENVISLAGEAVTFRADKPAIPDKPSYSSCSLDRKSLRQSVNNPRLSRMSGCRTADLMARSHIERPSVPPPERPVKGSKFTSSENLASLSELATEQPQDATENSGLHHSKSASKMNRFDFLMNQKEEKPPERPPRLAVVSCDPPESSPLAPIPRPAEVEKPKPPRPQPPLPAKPKQLVQNENTNL